MPTTQKFTTAKTGATNQKPTAVLAMQRIDAVMGSIIQLDGRKSFDPEGTKVTHAWRFVQVPIGSTLTSSSFRNIRPNATAVSFIPDKLGIYVVELIVNDGELDSDPITASVSIQFSRVPCGENLVPDAHFLWSYISNFWNLVEDREKITTVWSSTIQVIGAELVRLWEADRNKSLKTIQNRFQRRWLQFSSLTDLRFEFDQRIIIGSTDSGTGAATGDVGTVPGIGNTKVIAVPLGAPGSITQTDFTNLEGNYGPQGRVIVVNGETYTISRVDNKNLGEGTTLDTTAATDALTTNGPDIAAAGSKVGDLIVISSGADVGTYKILAITGVNTATVTDLFGGAVSFVGDTGASFILSPFSLALVDEAAIPDGQVGVPWRVPHLLHVASVDFEAGGVRAGDILVLEVTRNDTGLTTELRAQVTGSDGDRLGFEFTLDDLVDGSGTNLDTIAATNFLDTNELDLEIIGIKVGDRITINSGSDAGSYRIVTLSGSAATVMNLDGSAVSFVGDTGARFHYRSQNISRTLLQQLVQDLRIVPPEASSAEIAAATEALIAFLPTGINLSTRPFSRYQITVRAKEVLHNSVLQGDPKLISAPALQEQVKDAPVILRENLDYIITGEGNIQFVGTLFTLDDPAPRVFWAECAFFDNAQVIENNFGRLVELKQDDLTALETRLPYLSAVKGLFYAFTNGPDVANVRLALQILLGLPFTEERGVILEIDEAFTTDSEGNPLGRILFEDVDEQDGKLGIRRFYFFSPLVGLEDNLATGQTLRVEDTLEQFVPISKGITVTDYIKDPRWWTSALSGLEILKYFTFQVLINSEIFDSNDVQFGIDFIKKIKPAYTNLLFNVLRDLSEDIEVLDDFAFNIVARFYDNTWGLEATSRMDDYNQQGAVLQRTGSHPFATRTVAMLRDVQTRRAGSKIEVVSATGWDINAVRGRNVVTNPVVEGDHVYFHPGQPGAGVDVPGIYEVGAVLDANTMELLTRASGENPESFQTTALDPDFFELGTGLTCTILRRETNPVLKGSDLTTSAVNNEVTSLGANFLLNGASPGDHLIIEAGANLGEYYITELLTPPSTYISETQVALLNLDGTVAVLSTLSNQVFRVIRPIMSERRVVRARSIYNAGGLRMELEVPDQLSASDFPFDIFTPGMVGTAVSVSNSVAAVNDGIFQITQYLEPGRVVINNPGTTSDAFAISVVTFQ